MFFNHTPGVFGCIIIAYSVYIFSCSDSSSIWRRQPTGPPLACRPAERQERGYQPYVGSTKSMCPGQVERSFSTDISIYIHAY